VSLVATVLATAGACTGDEDTAGTSSTTSASSLPPPIDTISDVTRPPPARLDELEVALLGADEVGVPATWAIRDLDPLVLDPVLAAEADPFQGLIDCPEGALRRTDAWLQRTFQAPEQPLDNGLLSIDLIIEVEDDASAAAGRAALAACTAVGPDTSVDAFDVEVTVPGDDSSSAVQIDATEVIVAAGPSADVPYPSVAVAVTARRNGRSVTVVAAGVDVGVPLPAVAEELVGRLLARVG